MTQKSIMEKFASMEHERWAKWQQYMHSKMMYQERTNPHSGDIEAFYVLPADLFDRWERQIDTDYSELSEEEKESDRDQVKPYLDYVSSLLQTIESEIKEKKTEGCGKKDCMRSQCMNIHIRNQALDSAKAIIISKYKEMK